MADSIANFDWHSRRLIRVDQSDASFFIDVARSTGDLLGSHRDIIVFVRD
jgi:hypothetical protein